VAGGVLVVQVEMRKTDTRAEQQFFWLREEETDIRRQEPGEL
jgi:hypothetical protein